MLELLIRSPLQDDQKRFVTTASQSANNLLDIINEILDFSKIEAGQLTVENIAFNLTTLVEDCTSLLAERAHAKEIELICDVDPKLPVYVMGDPTRLRQVLINLIGNAIKFTETGEVVLRCSLNTKTNMLNFNVMDTGIGIPEKALAQLFTAFTQVDGSTTRKYGGTGLGLTISQRLTALMGGKLAVDSKEGKGSNFHFSLSLTEAETPNTVNIENSSLLTSLSDSYILIVDDNQTNLDVLSGYLTSWGITHDTAKSAKEALSLCKIAVNKNQIYDLALLDFHMPEMDGKQLAHTLKTDKTLAQMPLILLSSSRILDSEATKLGFSAWLDKPIRQSQLQNVMRKTLFPNSISSIKEEEHSLSTTLNGRVLLVDDHDVNLTIAKTTLEKMGVSVTTAINGQEAIDRWQQGGIDLILMDLQMPIMDGFQATQQIRQQENQQTSQRTPIIAMTANAMEEDKKRCLEYDMDGHLPKPFKWSQLEAMLSQWLPKNLTIDEKKDLSTPNVENLKLFIDEKKEPEIERLYIEEPILETESDTLDIERVNETIELFDNDFIELVEAMLESAEDSIIILAKASKDNDLDTLNSEGHRLKGGIGNLGSLAMMETCQLIERKSKAGELQEAKEQIEKLPLQFQQFKVALKDIIKNKLNHTLDI
ncbi:MAG: response regulator [Proteobacteria bacterium]|nr:response regulator [Pseudomonadota bacterium]